MLQNSFHRWGRNKCCLWAQELKSWFDPWTQYYIITYYVLSSCVAAVTVKSTTHQYLLTELTPKTHYRVQISGITSMGEGAPSLPHLFTTRKYGIVKFFSECFVCCSIFIYTVLNGLNSRLLTSQGTNLNCHYWKLNQWVWSCHEWVW